MNLFLNLFGCKSYHMIIIASFITTFTIIIITIILLIFIRVEYQLGHRPVFFSSCQFYSVRVTNFNKVLK